MQRRHFAVALAWAALGTKSYAAHVRPAPAPAPVLPPPPKPGARLLQLAPMAPTQAGETHSALAVSNQGFGAGGTPYRITGTTRVVRQLRAAKPNAWEVAWLFWNFADNNHTHYFLLKPNGWEIGKRDPRYVVPGVNDGQKIMATGDSVRLVAGEWYQFDVRVNGAEADIYVNGVFVCHFHDKDSAPLLGGRVGLYCEDSVCQWSGITAPVADGFDMEPVQAFADGSQLANWTVRFLGYGSGGIVNAEAPLL